MTTDWLYAGDGVQQVGCDSCVSQWRGLQVLDWTARVTRCGRICYDHRKINLSQAFAGQTVGVKQVNEHISPLNFLS